MLRIEFDGEPQSVFGGDVAGALEIFDRVRDRALHLARRAHQHVAAERNGVLAGFPEHPEQPLALLAGGEQPAIFDAEHADRNAAFADEIEHLRIAHAGIEAALEIGAAQFDRVEAPDARRIERRRQRRGVDRPHMQSEPAKLFRHALVLRYVAGLYDNDRPRGGGPSDPGQCRRLLAFTVRDVKARIVARRDALRSRSASG